jgi:hypothetical protein
MNCEQIGLGLVYLGLVLFRDALAQNIMCNGVAITPPYKFERWSQWYHRVQIVMHYELRVLSCGVRSTKVHDFASNRSLVNKFEVTNMNSKQFGKNGFG